jgi:radical SAM superfamily enzyme YgiQ (UPF0313 family)
MLPVISLRREAPPAPPPVQLSRAACERFGAAMLPDAQIDADVVLIGPREFEVTRSHRTYREKNFTSFADRLDLSSFQSSYIRRINESLGLEALAPYLRAAGLRVAILNCNVAPHTTDELVAKIRRFGAKVVGLSLIYRPQVAQTLEVIEALRAMPEVKICVGGALGSYMPHALLSRLVRLDAVVYGEAEETFRDWALAVVRGQDHRHLPGLAFRDGDRVQVNPPAPPLALANVLAPSRDTLGYLALTGRPTRIASLYTSRGCMARCTFCTGKDAYNVMRPPTYRYRDPDVVVDEIEALQREFGVNFVYINDDNFLGYGKLSYHRVRRFAEELIRRRLGIKFATECRVDGLDAETILLLKEAGMSQVLLGIESGSDRALTRWRKGATAADNGAALELMGRLGVQVEPGFILFDAHTGAEELGENLAFIRSTGLDRTLFPLYMVNRLSVYPGTAIEPILVGEQVLRPSAITADSPVRDDPGAVREEFQRLEYLAKDPRTEVAWRCLRWAIEPFEQGVEDLMPKVTAVLTRARTAPATRERAGLLLKRAARWRRGLGTLVTTCIQVCIDSYGQPPGLPQMRWLRRELRRAQADYDRETVGATFDAFMAEVMELRAGLRAADEAS